MGSGRPYQNKDYLRLLFGLLGLSIVFMSYSFGYMTTLDSMRSTYIKSLYEVYHNVFQDTSSGKSHYSQRVVVTGGLVRVLAQHYL